MKRRILALVMALITISMFLPTLAPTAEAYSSDSFPEKYSKQREECLEVLQEYCNGTLEGVRMTVHHKKFTIAAGSDYDYTYYGEMKHGKPSGYGYLVSRHNDSQFVGKFKRGKVAGYGIILESGVSNETNMYESNKCRFTTLRNFKASGQGIIYSNYSANDLLSCPRIIYEGELRKNERSGKGTAYEHEKGSTKAGYGTLLYEGSFKWDKYYGNGKLYYSDGTLKYKGDFKSGEYHGKGTLYNRDGSVKYKGKFKRGDAV